jgi:GAF domain-containing protein
MALRSSEELLARRERELRAVHTITRALLARTSVDDLVRRTLLAAVEAANAGAGSILLHDPERDRLVFRHVVGETPEVREKLVGREVAPDEGIAGAVFRSGRGTISPDVAADGRHNQGIDAETHYRTRNMIAVPLKTPLGHTLGVIEVLNRRRHEFDEADLEVLEILAGQAAAALETASLYEQVLEAQREKERFTREVIRCVTQDRLYVVDAEEIPEEGRLALEVSLEEPGGFNRLRKGLEAIAHGAGTSPERTDDLLIAVAEAAGNALKHAVGGRAAVYVTDDRVIVRVSDRGAGIRPEELPATLFKSGFSTKISLGMGYTLMLALTDRIWLATGPAGTTVQIEKAVGPPPKPDPAVMAALERFR